MPPDSYGREVSDKIDQGYLPAYLRIAAELGPAARVLELGVERGLSVNLWITLFPHGQVTGVDTRDDYPEDWLPPGCRVITADATSPDLPALLGGEFSLIVDDASHEGADVTASFGNLWPLVTPGGYYVIEDWWVSLRPGSQFGESDGGAMLAAVTGPLRLLDSPESECDEIVFRYGLCIVHKRRPG